MTRRRKTRSASHFAPALLVAFLPPGAVFAQAPLKCIDAAGKVTYTNHEIAGSKCARVGATISIVPSDKPPAPPAKSPQSQAKNERRTQLETEVANAQGKLEEAKKALAEQEAVRYGDERNYQRVLDRLKPYQDAVATAEKNVERAQEELNQLR